MFKKLFALIAVIAAVGVTAGVAAACEITSSTFYINCHKYTVDSWSAKYFYSQAAAQGGFYVPTSELSEEVAEFGYGSDGDEFLPSQLEGTDGLSFISVSLLPCAVTPPQVNNVHLLYSGAFNDNAKVFDVKSEIALLSSTSDHYDIGAAIKGATPAGTDAWSIGGYGVVSTQHIPSGDVFTGMWLSDDTGVVVSFPGMTYPTGATPNQLAELIAGPDGTGLHPIFGPPGS